MAESYLFNPTEGINKAGAQIQANLGNIFTGIIAQKQNDYNIAEKTFENINALTDKLGEYGQEEITSKTTSLLDDAAKSIIKNGKVDYSEIGRIRNGVSTIKNRKSAIEAGTQMYKEMAQTALATKDDLLNLGLTLEGMRNVILNPNNLSAEDMGRQMQAVYQKNINTSKASTDIFSRIAPSQTYEQTYSKDGATYGIAGKKISEYVLDPATGKFTAPSQVQAKNADGTPAVNPDGTPKMIPYSSQKFNDFMQAGGATVLDAIRKQMGDNSVFQSDEQLFESRWQNYVNSNNTIQKNIEAKSKAQNTFDEKKAEEATINVGNLPTKINLENKKTQAEINLTAARTEGERLSNQMTKDLVSNSTPLESLGISVTDNTKNVDFGKQIKVNTVDWNGKQVPFLATNLGYDKNKGTYFISGYPNPKSVEGKWEAGDHELVVIPASQKSYTYRNLISAVNALPDKVKANAKARLNRFHSIELGEQTQQTGGAPAPAAKTGLSEGYDAKTKTLYVSRSRGEKVYNAAAAANGAKHIRFID